MLPINRSSNQSLKRSWRCINLPLSCCSAVLIRLTGDRLGCFNLTLKGHGECVRFVKGFGVPLLVLGGGGYTIRNVARCWAYETSVVLDTPLGEDIPYNDYYEYYAPDFKLHLTPSMAMENLNEREELERTTQEVLENLSALEGCTIVNIAGRAAGLGDARRRRCR